MKSEDFLYLVNRKAAFINNKLSNIVQSNSRLSYIGHTSFVIGGKLQRQLLNKDGLRLSRSGAATVASDLEGEIHHLLRRRPLRSLRTTTHRDPLNKLPNIRNDNYRVSNTVLWCSEVIYQTYYYLTDNRGHQTRTRPTKWLSITTVSSILSRNGASSSRLRSEYLLRSVYVVASRSLFVLLLQFVVESRSLFALLLQFVVVSRSLFVLLLQFVVASRSLFVLLLQFVVVSRSLFVFLLQFAVW